LVGTKQRSYLRLGTKIGLLVGLAAGMPHPVWAQDLVEQGRQLFNEETFDGNGRTCATCHPATNNFTIDPKFIRKLPKRDPLFVAEFVPELKALEDSRLLRRFGLILENLDGFDRPGVMRGVPHNLALRTNTTSNLPGRVHALGWSGDGGADDGSIRKFAVGAIRQHFPKTLNRVEGVDFRLPTDSELDAIEAFMLSVGRQEDTDLAALTFAEEVVENGKRLFNGEGVNRACSSCHMNAGANRADGVNANFDQGTGALRPRRAPPDGGFGPEPEAGIEGFGDGTMNTPSLVEAADTPPYFHNNAARTLEDAVRFYTSDTFGESPAGQFGGAGAFELSRKQIRAISAFLRVVNAMENIRFSNVIAEQARRAEPKSAADERLREALAETRDAIEVLERGPLKLHRGAVRSLRHAVRLQRRALREKSDDKRDSLLQQAIELKSEASAAMIR
jgi:mono/diheme cytochrome c family protein